MPKILEVTVYQYSELSASAKEKARQKYVEYMDYSWDSEAMDSLKAAAVHFDGKLSDWSIDWGGGSYSSAKFDMPEMTKTEIRRRLRLLGRYNPVTLQGYGECKLTGVCFDENVIDGFRKAFKAGETDLEKLMQAGFKSWLDCVHEDYAYQCSEEAFEEHCEANDLWFTEKGKQFYETDSCYTIETEAAEHARRIDFSARLAIPYV